MSCYTGGWRTGGIELRAKQEPEHQHCTLAGRVTALEIHVAELSRVLQPGKKSLFITGLGQFPALFVSALEREVRGTRFDPEGRTGIA